MQFAQLILPRLMALFTIKDPPQNMLTVLDNIELLQGKTEKIVFWERECKVERFLLWLLRS